MLYKKLVEKINHILLKYYPIKISFDKINTLSHFRILSNNCKKILTINMIFESYYLKISYLYEKSTSVISIIFLVLNKSLKVMSEVWGKPTCK